MRYTLAFMAMLATDYLWAQYICATTDRRPLTAGLYSSGIVLLGGVTVLLYVADAWSILPAAAGAFCGTCWGVRRG